MNIEYAQVWVNEPTKSAGIKTEYTPRVVVRLVNINS